MDLSSSMKRFSISFCSSIFLVCCSFYSCRLLIYSDIYAFCFSTLETCSLYSFLNFSMSFCSTLTFPSHVSSSASCSSLSLVTIWMKFFSLLSPFHHWRNLDISRIRDRRSRTSSLSCELYTLSKVSPMMAMRRLSRTSGIIMVDIMKKTRKPWVSFSSAPIKSP